MTKATTWGVSVLAAFAAVTVGAVWYLAFHDYSGYFLSTKGKLIHAGGSPVSERGDFDGRLISLRSDSGLRVECGLLVPKGRSAGRRYPAVVLLGGVAAGKSAVDYVTGISNVVVAAPDYPYRPRESYTAGRFLRDLPAIRRGALDVVPSVMLLYDYLVQRPDVDPERIILVGYSFGAPFVPCLAALDRRPAAAVMVFGGGDLPALIRHNLRGPAGPAGSAAIGALSAVLLRPLEPLRYAGRISPVPLLMINGTRDPDIPPEYANRIYRKAKQPKRQIWLEAPHVSPRNVELTGRIVSSLKKELVGMGVLGAEN